MPTDPLKVVRLLSNLEALSKKLYNWLLKLSIPQQVKKTGMSEPPFFGFTRAGPLAHIIPSAFPYVPGGYIPNMCPPFGAWPTLAHKSSIVAWSTCAHKSSNVAWAACAHNSSTVARATLVSMCLVLWLLAFRGEHGRAHGRP